MLEKHGYLLSTVAMDDLVLKHQTISTHSAELMCIIIDQFRKRWLHLEWTTRENQIKDFVKKKNRKRKMLFKG